MNRPWKHFRHNYPACPILNIKLLELKKNQVSHFFWANLMIQPTGLMKLLWKFFYLKGGAGHLNVFM